MRRPRVLKAMRRPANQEKVLGRIQKWREICPDLTIRSTFIVGFPGETEAEFDEMLDWLHEAQLDRVGCFKYEPVEGAKANEIADHVDEDEKQDRFDRFMEAQRQISEGRMAKKVGRTLPVLIDEVDEDGADRPLARRRAGDRRQRLSRRRDQAEAGRPGAGEDRPGGRIRPLGHASSAELAARGVRPA